MCQIMRYHSDMVIFYYNSWQEAVLSLLSVTWKWQQLCAFFGNLLTSQ